MYKNIKKKIIYKKPILKEFLKVERRISTHLECTKYPNNLEIQKKLKFCGIFIL